MVFIPPNKVVFTVDQHQFLKDNWKSMTNRQLADALGMQLTRVRMELYSLGLKRMEMEYWTLEQVTFLQDNYQTIGDTELAEMFTERWPKNKGWDKRHMRKKRCYLNFHRTPEQIKQIFHRNKELGRFSECATNMWKTKGTANPDGTIVTWRTSAGRKIQLIKVNRTYVHLNVHVWKQHHGEIPKGMKIIRIDGNPLNNSIENLKMVTSAELGKMNTQNRMKYPEEVREIDRLIRKLNKQILDHGKK